MKNLARIFRGFRGVSEAFASRYIRLACSSLGKSGDDKSGRRDPWEAYCAFHDAQRRQAFNQTASIISSRALQDFTSIAMISSPSEI